VQTPNPASTLYRFGGLLFRATGGRLRNTFARLFSPEHVQYLSEKGLATLARRCAFEVLSEDTRPLASVEIATSLPIRSFLMGQQAVDRLRNAGILVRAVLRNAVPAPGRNGVAG
jgi:hypothetical protein